MTEQGVMVAEPSRDDDEQRPERSLAEQFVKRARADGVDWSARAACWPGSRSRPRGRSRSRDGTPRQISCTNHLTDPACVRFRRLLLSSASRTREGSVLGDPPVEEGPRSRPSRGLHVLWTMARLGDGR
jgi:hypothetical protein